MAETLAEAKKALRAQILAKRNQLTQEALADKSERIFARIAAMPEFQAAGTIFCYGTFRTELHTFPFMQKVLDSGKRLVMSRMGPKESRRLDLYQVQDLEADLMPGPFGIREPDPAKCHRIEAKEIDFILMPGSVFDRQGGRMGYGAGFYDTLIGSYAGRRPHLIAAALDLQVVDQVPMEPHDERMDAVVTETALYRNKE